MTSQKQSCILNVGKPCITLHQCERRCWFMPAEVFSTVEAGSHTSGNWSFSQGKSGTCKQGVVAFPLIFVLSEWLNSAWRRLWLLASQSSGISCKLCLPGSRACSYLFTFIFRGDWILIITHISRQSHNLQYHTWNGWQCFRPQVWIYNCKKIVVYLFVVQRQTVA